jgi:hypothetical protein
MRSEIIELKKRKKSRRKQVASAAVATSAPCIFAPAPDTAATSATAAVQIGAEVTSGVAPISGGKDCSIIYS